MTGIPSLYRMGGESLAYPSLRGRSHRASQCVYALFFLISSFSQVLLLQRVAPLLNLDQHTTLQSTLTPTVSGVMTVYQSSRIPWAVLVYQTVTGKWITAAFTMSVVTNLVASGLIATRLSRLDRGLRALRVPRPKGGLVVRCAQLLSFPGLLTDG
jgi:hypothetical protein